MGIQRALPQVRQAVTRFVLASVMLLAGVGIGAGAMSVLASHQDTNVIHACVDNQTGDVRIVQTPDECQTEPQQESRSRRAETTPAPERLVEWNKQGPQGPQGLPGDPADLPAESCPEGESAVGFDEDGQLLCASNAPAVSPDQTCTEGETVTGFDAGGNVLCAPQPVQSCPFGEVLVGFDTDGDAVCEDGDNLVQRDCSGVSIESGADLSNCDLRGENLTFAILFNTDLSYADLSGADLSFADLTLADLTGANLIGANLHDVDWDGTICPDGTNSYDTDGDGLTCLNNLEP